MTILVLGGRFMEKKQRINCTVASCKHNLKQEQECALEQIIVTPTPNCKSENPDESMCSSYKYDNLNK